MLILYQKGRRIASQGCPKVKEGSEFSKISATTDSFGATTRLMSVSWGCSRPSTASVASGATKWILSSTDTPLPMETRYLAGWKTEIWMVVRHPLRDFHPNDRIRSAEQVFERNDALHVAGILVALHPERRYHDHAHTLKIEIWMTINYFVPDTHPNLSENKSFG